MRVHKRTRGRYWHKRAHQNMLPSECLLCEFNLDYNIYLLQLQCCIQHHLLISNIVHIHAHLVGVVAEHEERPGFIYCSAAAPIGGSAKQLVPVLNSKKKKNTHKDQEEKSEKKMSKASEVDVNITETIHDGKEHATVALFVDGYANDGNSFSKRYIKLLLQ